MITQHFRETFKSLRNITVVPEPFGDTQEMETEIINATGRAPLSKAPVLDLIVDIALRAACEIHGKFLVALWKAYERLGYTPSSWSRSIVVPLFKRVDEDNPPNYRPIVLLSHARKVTESAIDSTTWETYLFHRSQYVIVSTASSKHKGHSHLLKILIKISGTTLQIRFPQLAPVSDDCLMSKTSSTVQLVGSEQKREGNGR